MASSLKHMELFEGAVVGAIESAFVAHQQGQALSVAGELLKDPSQASVVVRAMELPPAFLGAARHFVVEQGGFDGGNAAQAPAGGGHGLNQFLLDAALGIELNDVGIEKSLELAAGLGG